MDAGVKCHGVISLHPHLVPLPYPQEGGGEAGRGVGTTVVATGPTSDDTVDEKVNDVGSGVRREELGVEGVDTRDRHGVDASVGVVATADGVAEVELNGSVGGQRSRQLCSKRGSLC